MISYIQAIIIGLLQGITELFPISSLGHSVLIADLFGWKNLLQAQSASESSFLSFLVALHVATAVALIWFYRDEWAKITIGFISSVKNKKVTSAYEKMAWLLIAATIPAGLFGLIFEHLLRVQFAKPVSAAIFLIINGLILFVGDKYQRNSRSPKNLSLEDTTKKTSNKLSFKVAGFIGIAQVMSLMAGISRSGVTMVGGLFNGLDYESSARFSFLLATPIILAAGLYKLPDLLGHNGADVKGQIMAGAIIAGISAYFTVRYLDKYFQNKRLWPFAIYCVAFGSFMLLFQLF